MKKDHAWILTLVCLMAVAGVIASTLTLAATAVGGKRTVSAEQAAMIERYARLDAVRAQLADEYYQAVDEDALMLGAIRGMMGALDDPYTFYYTPEELAEHNRNLGGAYEGVGMLLQNNADGRIEIIRVYDGSPAQAGGLRIGDIVEKVDGHPVSGRSAQTLDEAVDRMRGAMDEPVTLSLLRGGERFEVTLKHASVNINNVSSAMLDGGIGYIQIYQFAGDAVDGFRSALETLQSQSAHALIIDLRNNPGGILDDVNAIADALLPEGCIVYTENREGVRKDFYSDADCCELPLCVLVNGMSASASEILAAAVQDFGRGTVVGTQTYGKGIVQSLISFDSDGAAMQYTSERYFTPSGKCIHGIGVTPDAIVEAGEEPFGDVPDPEHDPQLRAAMEIFSGE